VWCSEDNGEEGGEGGKRGITYEMAKNKGTSKRSKKSVRNPRVKRKVQYEKVRVMDLPLLSSCSYALPLYS